METQGNTRPAVRMIAVDMDGTLLSSDGQISDGNRAAVAAAMQAGVEFVVATGRRHSYAMRQLRSLNLPATNLLVSSNGAVVRRIDGTLIRRSLMTRSSSERLIAHLGDFRDALVITFDRIGADGNDKRGALVVEQMDELHASIDKWMVANAPYIAHVQPIERSLESGAPIQMMLCGTVARMARAEALLRELPGIRPVGETHADGDHGAEIALHRTTYPDRDLSIVDILPAGVSKGATLKLLSEERGLRVAEIMAVGDNWNDVSMLEIAGYPVVMSNAPADLLAVAQQRQWSVTGSNDEDGVAASILPVLQRRSGRGPVPLLTDEVVAV